MNYLLVYIIIQKKDFESGRVVGIKNSKYDLIFFLDSDNFITDRKFFLKFLEAYKDESILAAEPSGYTYIKNDNIANKIHSLIGCADPISVFIKNYAHYNNIFKKMMGINYLNIDHKDFVKIKFIDKIPTISRFDSNKSILYFFEASKAIKDPKAPAPIIAIFFIIYVL